MTNDEAIKWCHENKATVTFGDRVTIKVNCKRLLITDSFLRGVEIYDQPIVNNPTQTIYTNSSDEQGLLTAHILTNTTTIKPSQMCYFDTFEEMHRMVKEHYGEASQYVDRPNFLTEMSRRGMSHTLLA